MHRIWCCPRFDAERNQFFGEDGHLIIAAQRVALHDDSHPYWTRGLLPWDSLGIPGYPGVPWGLGFFGVPPPHISPRRAPILNM